MYLSCPPFAPSFFFAPSRESLRTPPARAMRTTEKQVRAKPIRRRKAAKKKIIVPPLFQQNKPDTRLINALTTARERLRGSEIWQRN
jgi:hypothetical protein